MNSYCEWCRGRYPEEGCCPSLGFECAWEMDQEEKENEDG